MGRAALYFGAEEQDLNKHDTVSIIAFINYKIIRMSKIIRFLNMISKPFKH